MTSDADEGVPSMAEHAEVEDSRSDARSQSFIKRVDLAITVWMALRARVPTP